MRSKSHSEVHYPEAQQVTTSLGRIKQAIAAIWTDDGPIKSRLGAKGANAQQAHPFSTPEPGPIFANGNCPGRALIDLSPEMRAIYHDVAPAGADYPQPGPHGYSAAIARFTGAPSDTVIPIGSGLKQIGALPKHLHPTDIVILEGDFPGYQRASALQGVPTHIIPANSGLDESIYSALAQQAAQAWRPLVMLTIGVTNPLATFVDPHRAVDAIKQANPEAIIIVDSAYAEYMGISQAQLTPLALGYNGVIVLAPGSKILFAAGAASGWMITGDESLLRHLSSKAWPYEPSGFGSRLFPRLIERIDLIEAAREQVQLASAILATGCAELFGAAAVKAGAWPWVLVDAGRAAGDIVASMDRQGIHLQRQSGSNGQLGKEWIRISSTTPDQAHAIIAALRGLLRGGALN